MATQTITGPAANPRSTSTKAATPGRVRLAENFDEAILMLLQAGSIVSLGTRHEDKSTASLFWVLDEMLARASASVEQILEAHHLQESADVRG